MQDTQAIASANAYTESMQLLYTGGVGKSKTIADALPANTNRRLCDYANDDGLLS